MYDIMSIGSEENDLYDMCRVTAYQTYGRFLDIAMQDVIYLRPMTVEDTDRIVTWRNRDFVRRNFIYQEPFTREGHLSWIRNQVQTGHVVQFMICLPDDRAIGSVYLRDIDRQEGAAEYGIFIGEEEALGHGYGTAAARLVLKFAFGDLQLRTVFLRFLADNIAARKSYEHAGFRMTDRKETVMTKQGEREVCFMEIDQRRFMDICGGKHG